MPVCLFQLYFPICDVAIRMICARICYVFAVACVAVVIVIWFRSNSLAQKMVLTSTSPQKMLLTRTSPQEIHCDSIMYGCWFRLRCFVHVHRLTYGSCSHSDQPPRQINVVFVLTNVVKHFSSDCHCVILVLESNVVIRVLNLVAWAIALQCSMVPHPKFRCSRCAQNVPQGWCSRICIPG